MMGRTHALAGVSTLLAVQGMLGFPSQEIVVPLTIFAALGALLPDLDATESLLKRMVVVGITPFAPLALVLNRALGHRGLLHSLLGWTLFSLLCLPLAWFWNVSLPFALSFGYASHLMADACTKSGIPVFYPRRKRYHLLPRFWRITTGSAAEEVVFVLLALFALALLLHQVPHTFSHQVSQLD